MERIGVLYRGVLLGLLAAVFLWSAQGLAKGCRKFHVELDAVTEVRTEIAKIKVRPGKIQLCFRDFGVEPTKLTKEELLAQGFVVEYARLDEDTTLGQLPIEAGTELSFPDIFAHDGYDFEIVSGG